MTSFKDHIAADAQAVFLNQDEFATLHTIDGREMWVIVDLDQQGRNLPGNQEAEPPSFAEGVSIRTVAIYVDPIELGYRPVEDQRIIFDGKDTRVAGVRDDDGLLMIVLEGIVG